MTIRDELIFHIDTERLNDVRTRIQTIEAKIKTENVDNLIAEFQHISGSKDFDKNYFSYYNSFESIEAFALKACVYNQINTVDNISKQELSWLVSQARSINDLDDCYLYLLEANISFDGVSDLFYYPDSLGYEDDLTDEQIVDILIGFDTKKQIIQININAIPSALEKLIEFSLEYAELSQRFYFNVENDTDGDETYSAYGKFIWSFIHIDCADGAYSKQVFWLDNCNDLTNAHIITFASESGYHISAINCNELVI